MLAKARGSLSACAYAEAMLLGATNDAEPKSPINKALTGSATIPSPTACSRTIRAFSLAASPGLLALRKLNRGSDARCFQFSRPPIYLLNAALSKAEREFTFNFLKIALMWLRTVNSLRSSFLAISRVLAPVNRSSYTSA